MASAAPPISPLVVALRVALATLAAGAVVVAVVAVRRDAAVAARRFSCPMHSEVTAAAPQDCPICGMALVELGGPPAAARASADRVPFAALRVSPEATSLLKFSVAQVRRNALPGEVVAPAIVGPGGEVVAQLYRDEAAALAPDERAALVLADPAAPPIRVVVGDGPPGPSDPRDAVVPVVFRAEPSAVAPRPGQVGWLKLAYKTRAMLVVRSAAILPSPDGPYVLVFAQDQAALVRRRVEIGKDYAGLTAVVSGLRDKEPVVMANTLAFDAERRLGAAP